MGQGVLKLWCYALFDQFQRCVEIVRKSDKKSATHSRFYRNTN